MPANRANGQARAKRRRVNGRAVKHQAVAGHRQVQVSNAKSSWNERFAFGCNRVARISGHPVAILTATASVLIWAALGPVFEYSEVWQLTINTGTTIVTFLMVFMIQNSQNRDTAALHLKIDELIRATNGARNSTLRLEDMTLEELDELRLQYQRLSEARGPGKRAAAD